MKRIKFLTIIVPLCALLILIVECFSTTNIIVAPEAQVLVVDKSGQPVADRRVTQTWTYFSIGEAPGNEEIRVTNKEGVVVFPERNMEMPRYAAHLSYVSALFAVVSPHASSGPHSYIFAERSDDGITYDGIGPSGGTLKLKD